MLFKLQPHQIKVDVSSEFWRAWVVFKNQRIILNAKVVLVNIEILILREALLILLFGYIKKVNAKIESLIVK